MTDWREIRPQDHAGVRAVGASPIVNVQASVKIYCDGAVLGNPGGPGGWGVVVVADSEIIFRAHGALFDQSNNQAEYQAIIQGLTWLVGHTTVYAQATVCSDSQLAINQITGAWACRAPRLDALREECGRLRRRSLTLIEYEWLPREANREADLEAARGVAEALGVDEEEALFVLEAQRKKYRFLKANKKAKKLLFNAGLVTNLIVYDKESKRRVIHRGFPPGR